MQSYMKRIPRLSLSCLLPPTKATHTFYIEPIWSQWSNQSQIIYFFYHQWCWNLEEKKEKEEQHQRCRLADFVAKSGDDCDFFLVKSD